MAARSTFFYPAIAALVALSALVGLLVLPRLVPGPQGLVKKAAPDVAFAVAANGDAGARMQVSALKGHPVILDFWATWCGPCNLQAPILDRVARRHEGRGLIVLGVNVEDDAELARSFAIKKDLHYPIVMDSNGDGQRLYGIEKLPSLVVIDKDGNVAAYHTGLVDEGTLDELVTGLL
jgi:thiol-disulfide isomerase/thioredoxin